MRTASGFLVIIFILPALIVFTCQASTSDFDGADVSSNITNYTWVCDTDLYAHSNSDLSVNWQIELGSAAANRSAQWPEALIYFDIDEAYTVPEIGIIRSAFGEFHDQTCVRFEERANQEDYLFISPGEEPRVSIGRQGGRQLVSIPRACLVRGTIQHLLMHSIGFFHENQRPDRDKFIDVNWNNILTGYESYFVKYGPDVIDTLGETYDYSSIMHLSAFVFSNDTSTPTIKVKTKVAQIGQRDRFSDIDLRKIAKYYECDNEPASTTITAQTSSVSTSAPTTTQYVFVCPRLNGYFPDVYDCSAFYQCNNGIAYHKHCKDDLLYNPEICTCDWPYNVNCTGSVPGTTGLNFCPQADANKDL